MWVTGHKDITLSVSFNRDRILASDVHCVLYGYRLFGIIHMSHANAFDDHLVKLIINANTSLKCTDSLSRTHSLHSSLHLLLVSMYPQSTLHFCGRAFFALTCLLTLKAHNGCCTTFLHTCNL